MNSTSGNYVCSYCGEHYTLGKNSTIDGCDECMKVVRNKLDNTIIVEEEADLMTDMEKA